MAATQTMLCLCHYDVDFVHFNTWRHLQFTEVWLVSISKQLKIQSNLDYPHFFSGPVFFLNINKL